MGKNLCWHFQKKEWEEQGKQAKQVLDWLIWVISVASRALDLFLVIWHLALGWLGQEDDDSGTRGGWGLGFRWVGFQSKGIFSDELFALSKN